jgi:hypothetical protein
MFLKTRSLCYVSWLSDLCRDVVVITIWEPGAVLFFVSRRRHGRLLLPTLHCGA